PISLGSSHGHIRQKPRSQPAAVGSRDGYLPFSPARGPLRARRAADRDRGDEPPRPAAAAAGDGPVAPPRGGGLPRGHLRRPGRGDIRRPGALHAPAARRTAGSRRDEAQGPARLLRAAASLRGGSSQGLPGAPPRAPGLLGSTATMSADRSKEAVGRAAARLLRDGMRVGLGTGSTAHWFIVAAGDAVRSGLRIQAVATSRASARLAEELGIELVELDRRGLDLAVDGADLVDPESRLIKGGGGAHVRERLGGVAAPRVGGVARARK